MLKFVSQIATAAAVAACASVSAQAMPMPAVDQIAAAAAPGAVQEVDWHGGWHGHGYYGGGGCYYGGCYHHHHNNYWVPLARLGRELWSALSRSSPATTPTITSRAITRGARGNTAPIGAMFRTTDPG